ncbi:30S ribosomal protein S9 [Patescibacteria group bacterium]|nr:30S ribosomal protein S9 [Patescibacteria group bacterium]
MVEKKESNKKKYFYAKGTNKNATANVRLYKGKGNSLINNRKYPDDFSDEYIQSILSKPFILTGTEGEIYFTSRVKGGGIIGQMKALSLAISRSLSLMEDNYRKTLSQNGLLRRDPRMVERKKINKVKSRKAHQFSKR